MPKHIRLAILRNFIDELAKIDYLSITSVIINKSGRTQNYDAFTAAWQTLFQRFENTMKYGNCPGGFREDFGIVIVDNTDGMKLQKLVRKMSVHNPVPNTVSIFGAGGGYRDLPVVKIIEDPNMGNYILYK
jgi:hypothetical protein